MGEPGASDNYKIPRLRPLVLLVEVVYSWRCMNEENIKKSVSGSLNIFSLKIGV